MTSLIGWWITREGLTRAHFVESEIAGDVVTHCGRRLSPRHWDGGSDQFHPAYSAVRRCASCAGQVTEQRTYAEPGEER